MHEHVIIIIGTSYDVNAHHSDGLFEGIMYFHTLETEISFTF